MADVKDLSAYKGVWVFAEQREGKIMPVVIELLGEGRKLADTVGCELCAVLLGDKVEGLTDELFAYGADKVYLADDPELKDYIPMRTALPLARQLKSTNRRSFC